METTYTVCGICEQACGLKVSSENNQVVKIEPDKDNTFSWRRATKKPLPTSVVALMPLSTSTVPMHLAATPATPMALILAVPYSKPCC